MQTNVTAQRVAWSIAEFAEATGLSEGHVRNEIGRGNIHATKSGRRTLIADEELRRYVAEGSSKQTVREAA